MKIVVFEAEPWESEFLEGVGQPQQFVVEEGPLTGALAERHADADIISTFIYSDLSRRTIEKFSHLKLIATRSTGYDHIDTALCDGRGIKVANVPSYGEKTVAEHVFALLLAISHRLIQAVDRTRRGDFSLTGLRGFDLQGRTLGIIGTGAIGMHAIHIAKGFEMTVVAFDVRPNEAAARELGFEYLGMDEVLERADILSLHVPHTPATEGMIGRKAFAAMKQGAVLINTSRGSVVDSRALIEALSTGRIAAAGLDVLPEEPVIREEAELLRTAFTREHNLETLLADHILLRLRNVIITPHSAFNTEEALTRILETTRDNIAAFVAGTPQNVVSG